MPDIGHCLDWLRFSTDDTMALARFIATYNEFLSYETAKPTPLPHYAQVCAYDQFRCDWHDEKPEQKILFTFTGTHLRRWGRAGGSPAHLLTFALACSASRITRLDFAIDLRGHECAEAQDIGILLDQAIPRTRTRVYSQVTSRSETGRQGCTVYLGARQSSRLLRVYDKSAQTDDDEPWIRIELETKKPLANNLALAMVRHGIGEAGRQAINDFVQMRCPWFDESVRTAKTIYVDPVGRHESDWEKWILDIALPNVIKALNQDVPHSRERISACLRSIERANNAWDTRDID